MKKIVLNVFALFAACFLTAQAALAQAPNAAPAKDAPKSVAIFVRDDTGKLGLKNAALEDMVSARLAQAGFAPVSHDLALRNLNDYLKDPNAQYRSLAEDVKKEVFEKSPADVRLFASASGLRIAQMLGVDYVLSISYSTFGSESRIYKGDQIETKSDTYTLRASYTLAEAGMGQGVAGGVLAASKTIRQTSGLKILTDDIVNTLADDVSNQAVSLLSAQNQSGLIAAKNDAYAEVALSFIISGLEMPKLIKLDSGEYAIDNTVIPANVESVNAQIDGITYTLNGAKLKLARGIHSLKVEQKDIAPADFNINVTGDADQSLKIQLALTEDARKRFKDDMAFVEALKERAMAAEGRAKISDAEAEKLRGIAQAYRNSGYKIDISADSLPDIIQQNQSLLGPQTGVPAVPVK